MCIDCCFIGEAGSGNTPLQIFFLFELFFSSDTWYAVEPRGKGLFFAALGHHQGTATWPKGGCVWTGRHEKNTGSSVLVGVVF